MRTGLRSATLLLTENHLSLAQTVPDRFLFFPVPKLQTLIPFGEILIPAVPAFVLKTDADAGLLTVRLLEGM